MRRGLSMGAQSGRRSSTRSKRRFNAFDLPRAIELCSAGTFIAPPFFQHRFSPCYFPAIS